MSSTGMMRKFRTVGIASVIFAVGAGIGWQFADLLFQEPATPMVAAIHFEGSRPHEPSGREATSRPQYEVVRTPAPAPQQPAAEQPDAVAIQSDEERKLAAALQWVDSYRQRQQAAQWEAVARHQQEMQRLAQLQSTHMHAQHNAGPHKVADVGAAPEKSARAGKAARTKSAHRRMAHRSRVRVETFICPLRWLQAVWAEPVMERRGRRPHRHTAAS